MKNNIEEDYCSLEVSQLLKEAGFAVRCMWCFTNTQKVHTADILTNWNEREDWVSRPTYNVALKWIRESFGIWIEIQHDGTFNEFTYKICKLNKKNIKTEPHYMHPFGKGFSSLEEATEAALLYTLENLI